MKTVYRLLIVLLISVFLFGCGGKKDGGVAGKVTDGQGQPLSGVSVIFNQVQPTPGAKLPQTKTDTDGAFSISGLMPASEYIITLESDTWTSMVTRKITTHSGKQSLTIDRPIVIRFYLLKNGTTVDTKTGLQWLIYTATDITAGNVINTVRNIQEGGFGDWRLPTKAEIQALKHPTAEADSEEPKISEEACCVWTAQINSDKIEWDFYIDDGNDLWKSSQMPANNRIVVVRTYGAPPLTQAATVVVPSPSSSASAPQPAVVVSTSAPAVIPVPPISVNKTQDADTIIVHFEPNKPTMTKEDLDKLKSFYTKVKDTPGLILIEGHSSAAGDNAMKDSVDLAMNTLTTLKKMGLSDKIKVEVKGVGNDKPIVDNNTPEGKVKNRRVELNFTPG